MFRVDRKTGPVWYAKYRQPDGRQVQKKIGPAWSERGRPPAGYFTKRTAEAWLRELLEQVRKGELPAPRGDAVTFADAAREWLRYVEQDRAVKPSTLRNYRSSIEAHLVPAFGRRPVGAITAVDIERWRARLNAPNTTNELRIGSGANEVAPPVYFRPGVIDEVAIYDAALDFATIREHAALALTGVSDG